MNKFVKVKKETEIKFLELRFKRSSIIDKFKKKLEKEKINEIMNSILDK